MISADVMANVRRHKNRRCEGQNLLFKSEKNYLSMIPNTILWSSYHWCEALFYL